MKFRCCLVLALATAAFANPHAQGESLPRSISTSRQFIVYSSDTQLRGALCDLAERTKNKLLGILRTKDDWKTPIVVSAEYPQANAPELPPAALKFSQTGFGLKLQLDIVIPPDVSAPTVQRELLRATLLELIYRRQPNLTVGSAYVEPPSWLLQGLLVYDRADPAQLLEPLLALEQREQLMPLEQFLQQRPALLEPSSRVLYSAYARALLDLLLSQPDGCAKLAQFIHALPESSNDPLADLRAQFSVFGDDPEKVWRANITQAAKPGGFRLLSDAETETQLDQILHVKIIGPGREEKTYALEEFPSFMRNKSAPPVLRRLSQDLMLLGTRANPLSRSTVIEYQQIAALLSRGKIKHMKERLDCARTARAAIAQRMQQIDDYLNWFEATQSGTPSGAFADYMRAAEQTAEPPSRRDPISTYLSAIETQFQN